jgi:hypothetical protein
MSDTDADTPMSRGEAFAELAARGADRVVVEFSGGNDEGGTDAITLYTGETAIGTLPSWYDADDSPEGLVDGRLASALSAPVFDRYRTFAGDFDVHGEVIWDVAARKVRMVKEERASYEYSEDLV